MKAKQWFYRIGQSDADRGLPSQSRAANFHRIEHWSMQQRHWYRFGYYSNVKIDILPQRVIEDNTVGVLP